MTSLRVVFCIVSLKEILALEVILLYELKETVLQGRCYIWVLKVKGWIEILRTFLDCTISGQDVCKRNRSECVQARALKEDSE